MLGPLAEGIARILEIILNGIQLLIIASVLISWVGADQNNQIVRMIQALTEPLYRPMRKLTKSLPQGPLDWAPTLLFLLVIFLQLAVVPYIRMLGGARGMAVPG